MEAREDLAEEVRSALHASSVLRGAADASIERLAQLATVRSFRKGEQIVTRGMPAREVGILVRGRARAVHFGADGREVTLIIVRRSDPLAFIASLSGMAYRTAFEAVENGTTVAMIPADTFLALLREEPEVMMSVIRVMAGQMFEMITMLKALPADVPSRIAIYVCMLLNEQDPEGQGPCTVDLGVSRVELAARLGTVPETLSRSFRALGDRGIIQGRGQKITVLDRAALVAHTNGVF